MFSIFLSNRQFRQSDWVIYKFQSLEDGEPDAVHVDDANLEETLSKFVFSLMEKDSKKGALKELQGHIWRDSYAAGKLKGQWVSCCCWGSGRHLALDVGHMVAFIYLFIYLFIYGRPIEHQTPSGQTPTSLH